jgi:hypothetical protein
MLGDDAAAQVFDYLLGLVREHFTGEPQVGWSSSVNPPLIFKFSKSSIETADLATRLLRTEYPRICSENRFQNDQNLVVSW